MEALTIERLGKVTLRVIGVPKKKYEKVVKLRQIGEPTIKEVLRALEH